MTGWSVRPPMMVPYLGRPMACVLVSNEILAAILQGKFDLCISSAPPDMIVVDANKLDDYTICIYVESATFDLLDDSGVVPVLDIVFTNARDK